MSAPSSPHTTSTAQLPPPTVTAASSAATSALSAPSLSTAPPASTPRVTAPDSLPLRASLPRGRRSKTHVVSACVNCKHAHLSCDVQRPCTRCVASAKQDTCVDVQHKKRGRPRLHPEGDPQASSSSSVRRGPVPPLTPTRTRSTRSVEGSSREVVAIGSETAAALLDLDLIVIKCNSAFNEAAFKDVRGLHISAFATPADPESFQNLRNRLRTEREAREPAFLPPILPQGQDPFGDISPLEAERYTEGFDNHTFQWIFGPHRSSAYTLTVRVRLAKASSYFVLVTLPTFQSSLAGRSMMQPSMAQISSATPSSPAAGSPHPLSSPYAMPPWRLLPAGPLIASSSSPSSSSTAYTPLHPPAGFTRPEYQLPPIRVLGPPIRAPQPRPLDESGDEGDDRRSPKRRRVSIHDVLQRPDRER